MSDIISLSNTNIPAGSLGLPQIDTKNAITLGDTAKYTVSAENKLPDPKKTPTTKTKTGSKGSTEETVNKISSTANKLVGEYSKFTSKVSQLTGGVINMLPVQYRSKAADVLTVLNTGTDVLETLASGQNGAHVQISSANPQPEAFKWVEQESIPADFVSYDSVLIFAGEPIYKDNPIGSAFIPLGFCQNFNISGSNNILTVQELRCEEQIVLPGKTMPVNINITRLCGDWRNLLSRLHITDAENAKNLPKWTYSMQYKGMRNLFGLLVMVMDTSRRSIVSQFYIERCAIQSWNWGMSAGSMQVLDNVSIIAGRIIDPSYKVEAPKVKETTPPDTGNADADLEKSHNAANFGYEGDPDADLEQSHNAKNFGEGDPDADLEQSHYAARDIKVSPNETITAVDNREPIGLDLSTTIDITQPGLLNQNDVAKVQDLKQKVESKQEMVNTFSKAVATDTERVNKVNGYLNKGDAGLTEWVYSNTSGNVTKINIINASNAKTLNDPNASEREKEIARMGLTSSLNKVKQTYEALLQSDQKMLDRYKGQLTEAQAQLNTTNIIALK